MKIASSVLSSRNLRKSLTPSQVEPCLSVTAFKLRSNRFGSTSARYAISTSGNVRSALTCAKPRTSEIGESAAPSERTAVRCNAERRVMFIGEDALGGYNDVCDAEEFARGKTARSEPFDSRVMRNPRADLRRI